MKEGHSALVWERPAQAGPIPSGEVHLWRIEVDRAGETELSIGAPLDALEQQRARRFHFTRDRNRFVQCHLALREILAGARALPPAEIEYAYGPYGKPSLENSSGLEFNLSHTRGLALIALSRAAPLGVDVEVVRRDDPPLDIADRFFSPAELRELNGTPPEDKAAAFFRCWTRKEAFIKAVGEGLSRDLQSFDVSLAPAEGARLLATRPDPGEANRWDLVNIDVGEAHAAALVTLGPFEHLRCWHYL